MTTKKLVEYANALQALHGDNEPLAVCILDKKNVMDACASMDITDKIDKETMEMILNNIEDIVNDHCDNSLVEILTDYLPDDGVDEDFEEYNKITQEKQDILDAELLELYNNRKRKGMQ